MHKKHLKIRRAMALVCAILLAALYLSTLILAVFDSTDSMMLFKASILATIIVPVLLWAYTFTFRLTRSSEDPFPEADEETVPSDEEASDEEASDVGASDVRMDTGAEAGRHT